jgi:hypothetical protein
MKYPEFFKNVPSITVYDDLCKFVGVNDDGIIKISYLDIVKMEGHSCATVAGSYISTLKGLKELYGDEYPKRGEIKVELKRAPTEKDEGVIGTVISNITGATTDFGFGGISTGKYNRRDLMFYSADIEEDICFTRLDTNKKVCINYNPKVIANPMDILMSAIKEGAKEEDIKSFPERFQHMVKEIFENMDKVIEVKVKD